LWWISKKTGHQEESLLKKATPHKHEYEGGKENQTYERGESPHDRDGRPMRKTEGVRIKNIGNPRP